MIIKDKLIHFFDMVGLTWATPVVKLSTGEAPKEQLFELSRIIGLPLLAILIFLIGWSAIAAQIKTSLGQLPGPVQVWEQAVNLVHEHNQERQKEAAFYQRQEERNAKKLLEDPNAEVRIRPYTGKSTFFDQIVTSLVTVFTGFLLGSIIAIPLGIACGLSERLYTALLLLAPVS